MSVEVTIRYATTVDSLADGELGDRLVSAPGHGVALRSKVGSRELLSAESYDSVEIAAMYALDALMMLGVLGERAS